MKRDCREKRSRRLEWLSQWMCVWSLSGALGGCPEPTVDRACEPGSQEGCAPEERCTLDEQLTPYCASLPNAPLPLGSPCTLSEECEVGAGCVSLDNRTRCVALCDLDLSDESSNQQCTERAGVGALCLYELPSRPEIGGCARYCELRGALSPDPAETPVCAMMGESCVLTASQPFATCAPYGVATSRSPCGASTLCAEDLSCLSRGAERRCQSVWTAPSSATRVDLQSRCLESELALPIEATLHPVSQEEYFACWARVELSLEEMMASPQGPLPEYYLELSASTASEAHARCALYTDPISQALLAVNLEQSATLREELSAQINDRLALLALPSEQLPEGVWVSAPRLEGEGEAGELPEGSIEPTLESCQRLSLMNNQLEATPCDRALPALCEVQRGPL